MAETFEAHGMPSARSTQAVPATQRRSLIPALTTLILASTVVLLQVLPRDPAFFLWLEELKRPTRAKQWDAVMEQRLRLDPEPGQTRLNAEVRTAIASRIPKKQAARPKVVVCIGSCASCVAEDLRAWKEAAARDSELSLVFIAKDSPERVREFVKERQLEVTMLADPGGRIGKAVNAVWFPRAYLIDATGRVHWVQKDDAAKPAMLWPQIAAARKALDD